jgi:hypothetical protein
MNLETLKISNHAKERYSLRIMDKESKLEVNMFIQEHEEKIKTDITKMIQYGTLLYSGKPTSDIFDRRPVDVYQNSLWIIIVDRDRNNVITLYSIDLGVGDEMNELYIGKLLEQLNTAKQNHEKIKADIDSEANMYKDIIAQNEAIIATYRKDIKELEKYNESLRDVIQGLQTKNTRAEREVRDIVAKMIGKKIF